MAQSLRPAFMDSIQPTILIVDDEKHTRDGLRRLLENDYDVYVAGDIASAMNTPRGPKFKVFARTYPSGISSNQNASRLIIVGVVVSPAPGLSFSTLLRKR